MASTMPQFVVRTVICVFASAIWLVAPLQAQQQSLDTVRATAIDFLKSHAKNLGELSEIELAPIDERLKLSACDAMSAALPIGSKPWGKVNVVVRCAGPKTWQVFLSATLTVKGSYYLAAKQLKHGQAFNEQDFIQMSGELNALPGNTIVDLQQAIGKSIQGSYSSGTVLREDMLKAPLAIQQGQTVKIVSSGVGFRVSTEATALTNANEGQLAKAKTNNGQVVAGLAKLGAIIEVQN